MSKKEIEPLDWVEYLGRGWIVGWIKGGMALIVDGSMDKIIHVSQLKKLFNAKKIKG